MTRWEHFWGMLLGMVVFCVVVTIFCCLWLGAHRNG